MSLSKGIIPASRAGRRRFDKAAHADDLTLKSRSVVPGIESVEVGITADPLLYVLDMNDAEGPVRSSLPCLRTEKKNGDEGHQDQDDHRHFQQRHPFLQTLPGGGDPPVRTGREFIL